MKGMPTCAGTLSQPKSYQGAEYGHPIHQSTPKHLPSLLWLSGCSQLLVGMQDFRRLYEVQRIVQACLPAEEQFQVVLPGWMRAYASAAWQDRYFAEQNFTPLQQVSVPPKAGQLMLGCQRARATQAQAPGRAVACLTEVVSCNLCRACMTYFDTLLASGHKPVSTHHVLLRQWPCFSVSVLSCMCCSLSRDLSDRLTH